MNLQNKTAVIYGAGGSLGGAIAKAFAAAGARVFLTGHRAASVQKTADQITAAGGRAEVDLVDAFDEEAVTQHLETVVRSAGSLDIAFNAVDIKVVQNIPLTDIPVRIALVGANCSGSLALLDVSVGNVKCPNDHSNTASPTTPAMSSAARAPGAGLPRIR